MSQAELNGELFTLERFPPNAEEEAQLVSGQPVVREGAKVGRNDPCPCGSGKKYKNCHGQTE